MCIAFCLELFTDSTESLKSDSNAVSPRSLSPSSGRISPSTGIEITDTLPDSKTVTVKEVKTAPRLEHSFDSVWVVLWSVEVCEPTHWDVDCL